MMVEMRNKLILNLESEKKQRESNQEFLFRLLDQTVAKVQDSLSR